MNNLPDFDTYVYKYMEATHSGVWANVIRVNPKNPYTKEQREEAFKRLYEYAAYSITAYLAIEWWSKQRVIRLSWLPVPFKDQLPTRILKAIVKPKLYNKMGASVEQVPNE